MENTLSLHDKIQLAEALSGQTPDATLLERAAAQHGNDAEPDHEAGDLQEYLRVAFGILTATQRRQFYRHPLVRSTLATGLGVEETVLAGIAATLAA